MWINLKVNDSRVVVISGVKLLLSPPTVVVVVVIDGVVVVVVGCPSLVVVGVGEIGGGPVGLGSGRLIHVPTVGQEGERVGVSEWILEGKRIITITVHRWRKNFVG